MKVEQRLWTPASGWSAAPADGEAQLVFVFGSPAALHQPELFEQLRAGYPVAVIAGCSTAGEIQGEQVHDDSLAVTAVRFERSTVAWTCEPIDDTADGSEAACRVVSALDRPGLRHVLVLCDGLAINGTAVACALQQTLPAGVSATGGLAADGSRFGQTFVVGNAPCRSRQMLGIGLYGADLRIGYGSLGGWDSFGPLRRITRAQGKVLFELDGQSALGLYKAYLGPRAAGLPATALSFPLMLEGAPGEAGLIRAVLTVDESTGSLVFGGDMPEGARASLMKANVDHLVDGAAGAAAAAVWGLDGAQAQLALLISCVGRKQVMRQRVEEEIDSVREMLPDVALTGFYSYGEFCPPGAAGGCVFHNETMTVTTIAEA